MRDYSDFVTPQHRAAPKFVRHIQLMTRPLQDIAALAGQLNGLFSLDGAFADSDVSDHLFRRHPISYSDIFRSPIPVIFDHVFAHLLTRF
ncbi:MAG: hypothetical protein ACMX3H_17930 [Sodalis sp. (in: enterobacteria)]|uniref:hypothetical protein n=1 Tax=Sodalis sp. (in: enterobacteria) TaxID=1898979 RepID=UPI0039E27F47